MKQNYILEDDCYISLDKDCLEIHLDGPEGFIRFCQAFWKCNFTNAIVYYSHLIMDGENNRRYCPDLDYFDLEGLEE